MNNMTNEQQIELTKAIMAIIDSWGMSSEQVISLLALPAKTPGRALRKYRDNTPFPETPEVYERLEHIIGIADALRTSYPHNPHMGKIWLTQSSKKFQNRVPLEVILNNGVAGLVEVRSHLDCSYDWDNRP